jgi:hypothetical protein
MLQYLIQVGEEHKESDRFIVEIAEPDEILIDIGSAF